MINWKTMKNNILLAFTFGVLFTLFLGSCSEKNPQFVEQAFLNSVDNPGDTTSDTSGNDTTVVKKKASLRLTVFRGTGLNKAHNRVVYISYDRNVSETNFDKQDVTSDDPSLTGGGIVQFDDLDWKSWVYAYSKYYYDPDKDTFEGYDSFQLTIQGINNGDLRTLQK